MLVALLIAYGNNSTRVPVHAEVRILAVVEGTRLQLVIPNERRLLRLHL